MILDDATPILALALDRTPDLYNLLAEPLSKAGAIVPESEILSLDWALERVRLSDVSNLGMRLFIPITDELYDAHHTGSQSHHNKDVVNNKRTTTGGESEVMTTVSPGRNSTTLNFNIRSNLSTLSVIADILAAVTRMNVLNSADVPRASFFSASRCIINARLVGVNRTTESESDKEIITLTLEEGDGRFTDVTKKDTPEVVEDELAKVVAGSGFELLGAENTQTDGDLEDFNFDAYAFYPLLTAEELKLMPVPDMLGERTIQRQEVRIFRVKSQGPDLLERDMQGVEFVGQHISLESSEPARYENGLALVRYFGDLYLGVARVG